MDILCTACSTKLVLPDAQVPKGVESFRVKCPKCAGTIQVSTAKTMPPPMPTMPPPPQQAPAPAPFVPDETDFVEGRRLAMVCFDQPELRGAVKAALEALGMTAHAPATGEEAMVRFRRSRYEVLMVHEEFGGPAEKNVVLATLGPMDMAHRRHACVGLVGKSFRTLDHMMAFARSVNFVVAEREIGKIEGIVRQALADNDLFYKSFREALKEAGRV